MVQTPEIHGLILMKTIRGYEHDLEAIEEICKKKSAEHAFCKCSILFDMDPSGRNSPEHQTDPLTEFELSQDNDLIPSLADWELYRIERLLGIGGMARVYLAFDRRLNRYVALKFIRSDDEKMKARLLKEARAQAQIEHDQVCKIYEASEINGRPYIAMQYINGKNLDAINKETTLAQRVRVMQKVANAVQAAHALGIIHHDIKPSNIMIEQRNDGSLRPYILDFGIARDIASPVITVTERILGTPAYMSPELAGGAMADRRTDIYSMGATLYKLSTGRSPFEGANSLEILTKVLQEEPVPPRQRNREIPEDLETIILKSMDKQPENRYESAEMLGDDLARYLNGESILARRSSWTNRAARKVKRDPRISALFAAVSVAVVLAVAVVAWMSFQDFQRENIPPAREIRSIAVLPFTSPDASIEYLADGITEGLINHLSQIPRLKVLARDTVFTYKGKQLDPRKVARDLKVDAVVTGQNERHGDLIIVRTHLINGLDGSQIWGKEFSRKLTDLARMSSEIATQIANKLGRSLTPEEKRQIFKQQTENSEAYLLYLKGRHFWYKRSEEGNKRAAPYFLQAIEKDPTYALSYAFLANTYEQSGMNGWTSPKDAFPKAKVAALKALEIDSGLGEAHVALASDLMFYEFNWSETEKELMQALRLNPNDANAHRQYSYYLAAMHRTDDAIAEMKEAQKLDPLSVSCLEDLGWMFVFARKYDQAINQANAVIELDANHWSGYLLRGESYLQKKLPDKALEDFQFGAKLSNNDQYALADLGYVYAELGNQKEAIAIVKSLLKMSKRRYVAPLYMAAVYCALRDNDRAFEWLDKAYEERGNANFIWLDVDPWWDPIRSDPRFTDLLRRLNLRR